MNSQQQDIYTVFRASAEKHSSQTAITYKFQHSYATLTYSELIDKIERFTTFLRQKGVEEGDRVVMILHNQPEFPVAFFALMSIGAVAVPVDVQYPTEQVKGIIKHCEAKLVLTTVHHSEHYKDGLGVEICMMDKAEYGKVDKDTQPVSADVSRLAVIFYTSGTTSEPKGVMLSQNNILSNFSAISRLGFFTSQDIYISILPLHHAYAFNASMLSPLLLGGHVAFVATLSSTELIGCMQHVKATVFIGVPQLYTLLHKSISDQLQKMNVFSRGVAMATGLFKKKLKQKFGGRLRYLICGGAKMDKTVAEDFKHWGFQFLEGYGLTETAPVVTFNTPAQNRIGSVGRPLEGVDIQIRAGIDQDKEGEVWVRGKNVMLGYYRNQEKTDEVIKGGWFYTGDLGYIDHDGFLHLTGRKNEMIVLPSGKNIFPADIENEYERSPFVKEIGVLCADGDLVAVIQPDENYFKKEGVSQIRDRLKWEMDNISENLPTYKRIKGFVISLKDLPHTRLGKLRRFQLLPLYKKLLEKIEDTPTESEAEIRAFSEFKQKSLAIIEKRLGRKVTLSSHLELDLGLDSLNKVEMLLEIQEALKLKLDDAQLEAFYDCSTIEDLLGLLENSVGDVHNQSDDTTKEIQWKEILDVEPDDVTKKKIKLHFRVLSTAFNFLLVLIIKLMALIFFRLEVKGRENLNADKPYILCSNHVSYLDALFIVAALPMRQLMRTYFLGLSVFFENGLIRPFMSLMRLIPIEVNYNLVEALRSCVYVYSNGKNVCLFPEGQRSIDGEIKEFKKGVGILITEYDIPVVPVFIDGAFRVWPRTRKWPRCGKVCVNFGPITSFHESPLDATKDKQYIHVANRVKDEVSSLSGAK